MVSDDNGDATQVTCPHSLTFRLVRPIGRASGTMSAARLGTPWWHRAADAGIVLPGHVPLHRGPIGGRPPRNPLT
ncbi:hypothetical protein SCANM63S_06245 [Streptomyces canarius]